MDTIKATQLSMADNEGLIEDWLLGLVDGFDKGHPDELDIPLGWDGCKSKMEGLRKASISGILDNEGGVESWLLGSEYG